MVDVSAKQETSRLAIAQSRVILGETVLNKVENQSIAKGDLLATARIAGIQGAKKCADLIPLCHPLPLSKVTVDIESFREEGIYDMCKALDKGIAIESVQLLEKQGGKSGHWLREGNDG